MRLIKQYLILLNVNYGVFGIGINKLLFGPLNLISESILNHMNFRGISSLILSCFILFGV